MIPGYPTSLLLLSILVSIDGSQAREPPKAPPILWHKTDTKVVGETVDLLVEIAYCNHCKWHRLVEKYHRSDQLELELLSCKEKFGRLVWMIDHLVSLGSHERGTREHSGIKYLSDFYHPTKQIKWRSTDRSINAGIASHQSIFDRWESATCEEGLEKFIAHNPDGDGDRIKFGSSSIVDLTQNMNRATKLLSKLALPIASKQLNLTVLDEIVSDSLSSGLEDPTLQSVSSSSAGHLRLRFSAKRLSPGAHVYQVRAFTYWRNLLSIPELMYYTGPPYLLYNSTSNCAKSLNSTVKDSKILVDRCVHRNYADVHLSSWTEREADVIGLPTSYLPTKDSTFIYCFPNNITIDGHEQECPPWVIKLANSSTWRTGVGLAASSILADTLEPPRVPQVHFRGDPYINNYFRSIRNNFMRRTESHVTQSTDHIIFPLSVFVNVFLLLAYLRRIYVRQLGSALGGHVGLER